MVLCFASLGNILYLCSKPDTTQKLLVSRIFSSINWEYGDSLETNDTAVSKILSCDTGLSPKVKKDISGKDIDDIVDFIDADVLPLLDDNKHNIILAALKDLITNSDISDDIIGSRTRGYIISSDNHDVCRTIADILYYTVSYVNNRKGKDTISQINEEYIHTIEAQLSKPIDMIVENTELKKTITDSNFENVFSHFDSDAALDLSNQCGIDMYYLDISNSAFDYYELCKYLLDCVGMYVYSRSDIKRFEESRRIRSIGLKAVKSMNENGKADEKGSGNELGEMLVYALIEEVLNAPKLLSKVEISGSKSRSDSLHLLKRNIKGEMKYQLVCGTSSIHDDIYQAIDEAFEIIERIKIGQVNERKAAQNTLYNNTYDSETTEVLKSILIPSKDNHKLPDMAFGVFIGYSLGITNDINDQFITEALEKMKKDIEIVIPYIMNKAASKKLGMHSCYFYFLPMNSAEKDKKRIMLELLGGQADNG
ncbi:MAG: DUF1837 domain-containing protein [Alistipes sp.]|nr:DUF1837 domain-containing protein [Alistipes sp.]